MDLILKYGKVYNLNITKEEYKGIYLGKRTPGRRPKSRHVILVNKPAEKLSLYSYSLIAFTDYRFNEDKKLILQKMHYICPNSNVRSYLEELLEMKLNSS